MENNKLVLESSPRKENMGQIRGLRTANHFQGRGAITKLAWITRLQGNKPSRGGGVTETERDRQDLKLSNVENFWGPHSGC